MEENNMDFKISQELAQELLNYLSERPYREVFKFINGLAGLKPLSDRTIPDKQVLNEESRQKR